MASKQPGCSKKKEKQTASVGNVPTCAANEMLSNQDKTPIKCGECNEMLNGKDALYNHYYINFVEKHEDHMKLLKSDRFQGKHKCNRCAAKFKEYIDYFGHMVDEVKLGCCRHRNNLDDMTWTFVRRDMELLSQDSMIQIIVLNSEYYNDYCEEIEEQERCFGYSADTFNMLLSYGVKPWEEDADYFLEQMEEMKMENN